MKSLFYSMTISLLLLSSCNQEELASVSVQNSECVKVVNVVDGKVVSANTKTTAADYTTVALQFSSEIELQNILNKFACMSVSERLAFTDSLGFISLEKLLRIADMELDSIGASSVSDADFRTKYNVYKEKYSNIFVFNDQKSDDLSPYIPASKQNNLLAYLVGGSRFLVIGNSANEISFSNVMRDEDDLLYNKIKENSGAMTRAVPVNSFKITSGSKKTIFDTEIRHESIGAPGTPVLYKLYYHFGAQKKMWYGWKRDSDRDFAITSTNNNNRYISNSGGNIDVYSYYYLVGPTDVFTELVYVWTDITLKNASGVVVYDRNKAYQCQINKSYN